MPWYFLVVAETTALDRAARVAHEVEARSAFAARRYRLKLIQPLVEHAPRYYFLQHGQVDSSLLDVGRERHDLLPVLDFL